MHTADDIVAETFMAAFKQYYKDFEGKAPQRVEALLVTIANRRIYDLFRGNRPTLGLDELELLNGQFFDTYDPLRQVIEQDAWERIWDAIAKDLTVTEHQVAWLSWQLGISDTLIAQILGIPSVGTVRTHRSRAKKKIVVASSLPIDFADDLPDG
jgi:RNA polymerase sigma factor (sigma-70 family)